MSDIAVVVDDRDMQQRHSIKCYGEGYIYRLTGKGNSTYKFNITFKCFEQLWDNNCNCAQNVLGKVNDCEIDKNR